MKKLALATILTAAVSTASAFDMPFFNNDNNYGYVEDNGLFAFNPWEMTDPRWYSTEFTNMINEFDEPDYLVQYQPNPYSYGPTYGQRPYYAFPAPAEVK